MAFIILNSFQVYIVTGEYFSRIGKHFVHLSRNLEKFEKIVETMTSLLTVLYPTNIICIEKNRKLFQKLFLLNDRFSFFCKVRFQENNIFFLKAKQSFIKKTKNNRF